ncbi:MAG: heme biosynthesis protein HemY [Magnetospirillum sp. WYHS-4]
MWRNLFLLAFLCLLAFAAAWMADRPGSVVVDWQGHHIETSFALVAGLAALLAIVSALSFRLVIYLLELPGRFRRRLAEGSCRKGYLALTRGLVAVAAGDAQGVRDQAWRVEKHLQDPPLTLLLFAQAAQLSGDDLRAAHFFRQMLDDAETEFFGLRGLAQQALKHGQPEEARRMVARAFRLNPRSEWAASHLLALEARSGHWDGARALLIEASRHGSLPGDRAKRGHAVVELELATAAEGRGDLSLALRHLRQAVDLRPDFVPASVRLVRALVAVGKMRKAVGEAEAAWGRQPHTDLFEAYCLARQAATPLERAQAADRLAKINPGSRDGRLVAARANLAARLWGEARKHLGAALEMKPTVQVFRLLAEVEETEPEQGTPARAREWLVQASLADPDPAWVCADCGATVAEWSPFCGACQGFDTLAWKVPPHVHHTQPPQAAAAALPLGRAR